MTTKITRYQLATAVAVIFHTVGLIGILYFDRNFFSRTTVYNLLLMFALLVWTQKNKDTWFFLFLILAFLSGIGVELVGVHTRALFGDYQYGNVLGPRIGAVPVIIGINWFVIIYSCGISIHTLLLKAFRRSSLDTSKSPVTLKTLSVIIDGATLAVFFDWIMEPVAIKLKFWQWNDGGAVPGYNYLCWFLISMALLALFHACKFDKQNKFAVNLLLIQLMFFLLLRTLLP